MNGRHPPTSWPLSPTSTPANLLHRQLKTLRSDISELAVHTENAANRIAQVLKRLRSSDESDSRTSYEPVSHESDLSATMRDHPFERCSFQEVAAPDSPEFVGPRHSIAVRPTTVPTLGNGPAHEKLTARFTGQIPLSVTIGASQRSTYEQSRTFLAVTSSMRDECMRAKQCDIVEVCSLTLLSLKELRMR